MFSYGESRFGMQENSGEIIPSFCHNAKRDKIDHDLD